MIYGILSVGPSMPNTAETVMPKTAKAPATAASSFC